MTDKPTRRDLMKPVQLLGIAFGAAVFAGLVTAMAMGAFTGQGPEVAASAWRMAAILAGVSFIAVLLIMALLLLAVDPKEIQKGVDRPVLVPDEDDEPEASSARD